MQVLTTRMDNRDSTVDDNDDADLKDITLRLVSDSTKNEMVRACIKGDAERVASLINNGSCFVDMRDSNDFRAPPILHIAASNGHVDVVSLLLACGATVDAVDKYGFSALHKASKNGHQDVVDLLIQQGAKVYLKDKDDGQLEIACKNGPTDVVDALISRGCCVGERHLYAAYLGRRRDVAECLVKHGVLTPRLLDDIHIVCFLGLRDRFDHLIKGGVNINQCDSDKMTPFLVAARFGHVDLVHMCLEFGAKSDEVDGRNWTALHHASVGGYESIVRILVERRLNIEAKDGKGRSSLHLACERKHINVVESLLDFGAAVNEIDIYGRTPLYYARTRDVAEALLDCGADVNAKDSYTRTPLHVICESQDADACVVETLIEHGVKLDARDWRGNIALVNACTAGNVTIVETLLKYTSATDNKTGQILISNLEDALVRNAGLIKNMKIVETLSKYGVNLDRTDTRETTKGNTPLINSLELYVDLMHDFPDLPTPEFLLTDVRLFVFAGCRIDILFSRKFLLMNAYQANPDTLHLILAAGCGIKRNLDEDLLFEIISKRDWDTLGFVNELGYEIPIESVDALCERQDMETEKIVRQVIFRPRELKTQCRLTIRKALSSKGEPLGLPTTVNGTRGLSHRIKGFVKDIFHTRQKSANHFIVKAIPLSTIGQLPLPKRMKDYISFESQWSVP
ncbi:ankyrin repeat domain-containing protein 50-like [Lineus longissimus]|uniref:ankyrin repeat domain-containing protein 50-like n=1 Tax=Lineus longissimus TaxID=88925 RepID=UPI00315CBAE2